MSRVARIAVRGQAARVLLVSRFVAFGLAVAFAASQASGAGVEPPTVSDSCTPGTAQVPSCRTGAARRQRPGAHGHAHRALIRASA